MLGLAMLTTNSAEQKMWAKLPGLFATLIAKPTLSSLPQSTENETEDDTVATLSSAEVRHTKSEKLHRSCPNDEHSTESCQIPQMHPHLHHRDSAYSDESIMCHNVRPVCDEECEQEEVIDCQQPAVEQQYDEFDLLCDCLSTSEPRNKYLEDSQKLQLFPPEDTEFLLPPKIFFSPKKTLVLDLDETLMHSSLEPLPRIDHKFDVTVDGVSATIYMVKRPGVEQFLQLLRNKFELVIFTASIPEYADKVIDFIDVHHAITSRLYRSSCAHIFGNYVKDLDKLGRDMCDTVIIDNTPASYMFHPHNAVPISSFTTNPNDTELMSLEQLLCDMSAYNGDVRTYISEHIVTIPSCPSITHPSSTRKLPPIPLFPDHNPSQTTPANHSTATTTSTTTTTTAEPTSTATESTPFKNTSQPWFKSEPMAQQPSFIPPLDAEPEAEDTR